MSRFDRPFRLNTLSTGRLLLVIVIAGVALSAHAQRNARFLPGNKPSSPSVFQPGGPPLATRWAIPRVARSNARTLLSAGESIFLTSAVYDSGGSGPSGVAAADFNRDGKQDLVVANFGGTVGVLLGNGYGTYLPAVSYPAGGAVSVVSGDFNRDGDPDVAVADYTGGVNVLLGNGDGSLQAFVTYSSGGQHPYSVTTGDFNNDGKLDLAVANICVDSNCANGSVGILLGNGDGSFQTALSYPSSGLYTYGVVIGDFNRDGESDLALGNNCSDMTCIFTSVSVLLGKGNGTFQTAVSYVGGYAGGGFGSTSLAVGDLNRDGNPDLVSPNWCASPTFGNCPIGSVSVFLGMSNGTFQPAVMYESGSNDATAVAIGDFNADGKPDVAVSNRCSGAFDDCFDGSVGILLGNGDGTLQPAANYSCGGAFVTSLLIADLNRDGRLDLSTTNYANSSVGILLGNGDGTFHAARNYPAEGQYDYRVAVADFNGDGNPDVAISNQCADPYCLSGSVGVFLGNFDGTFQPVASYTSAVSTLAIQVGDFNGDGKPDLAVVNYANCPDDCANGSVGVMLGNGDGTLRPPMNYVKLSGLVYSVTVGDFNGDGKLDAAATGESSSSVSVMLGNGDGTLQGPVSYASGGQNAEFVITADFNHDGKLDLAVANLCADGNCTSGSLGVSLGNGDGSFQPAAVYPTPSAASSVIAGDFNGDGTVDLASAGGVFLGNGDGTFQPAISGAAAGNVLAAADFNGDGSLDLTFPGGLLLGNGNGTFQSTTSYNVYGVGLAVGDFNHDGKPDLAAADGGGVIVLLNVASGFRYATTTTITSSPNPSKPGQSVTFTAPITPAFAGMVTGSVTFYDGSITLATIAVSNGQATFSTSSLNLGVHSITATYSGDGSFLPSTSAILAQKIIDTAPPSITVSADPKILWPPDNRLVPVRVAGTITDRGSGVNPETAEYAVKDEYGQVQPKGKISLGPTGEYKFTVLLRASRRADDKDGRHYVITVTAKDRAGNRGSESSVVIVPHNKPR